MVTGAMNTDVYFGGSGKGELKGALDLSEGWLEFLVNLEQSQKHRPRDVIQARLLPDKHRFRGLSPIVTCWSNLELDQLRCVTRSLREPEAFCLQVLAFFQDGLIRALRAMALSYRLMRSSVFRASGSVFSRPLR
jgi:hypothetical protein